MIPTTATELIKMIWMDSQSGYMKDIIRKYESVVNGYTTLVNNRSFLGDITIELPADKSEFCRELIEDVCRVFDIERKKIYQKRGVEEICYTKFIICHILGKCYFMNLKDISMGIRKDHSTVIHAKRRAHNLLEIKDNLFVCKWNYYIRFGNERFTKYFKEVSHKESTAIIPIARPAAEYLNKSHYGIAR